MNNTNLWPELNFEMVTTPKSILALQAKYLSEMTKNVLQGEIRSSGNTENISLVFDIVAPAISNYKFQLFIVQHDIKLYPLKVIHESKSSIIENEEKFEEKISEIFKSPSTIKIINNLYSQSVQD